MELFVNLNEKYIFDKNSFWKSINPSFSYKVKVRDSKICLGKKNLLKLNQKQQNS